MLSILNHFQAKTHEANTEHCYRMKQSHKETMNFALLSYAQQVNKKYPHLEFFEINDLPPWITSCRGLTAHFNHGSPNTIYGHRKRLVDLGLLVRVESADNKMRQGWYLNPMLLLEEEAGKEMVDKFVNMLSEREGDPEEPENQKVLKNALNAVEVSIIEYLEKGVIKETINGTEDNVDNSPPDEEKRAEGAKAPGLIYQSSLPEHREKGAKKSGGPIEAPAEKQEQIPAARRAIHGPATAKKTEKIGRKVPETGTAKRKTQFPPFLLALILRFWAFAKAELYPDREFTPEETRDILNAIYYSEFSIKKYPGLNENQWNQRYGELIGRVRMARNYVEKHALYVPRAAYYFSGSDPDNPNAFKFCRTHDFIAKAAHDKIKQEIKQWKRDVGRYANHSAAQLQRIHISRLMGLESKKYNQIYLNKTIHSYVRKAGYHR